MNLKALKNFWECESGTTQTEYAVLLSIIVAGVLFAVSSLGLYMYDSFGLMPEISQNEEPSKKPKEPETPKEKAPPTLVDLMADAFDGKGTMTWDSINGKWQQKNGTLSSNSRYAAAVANVPASDYVYSLDMQTTDSQGKTVWDVTRALFRYQDKDNYYAVVPKSDGMIELAKMQNGEWRPWLGYATTGLNPTQMQNYQVVAKGNTIQVWANGQQYIEYVDPNPILTGGVGAVNSASKGTIDNVKVSTWQNVGG